MYVNERNSMSAAQGTTVHPGLPGPSASEIKTLWRYTNLFIIIVIIIF